MDPSYNNGVGTQIPQNNLQQQQSMISQPMGQPMMSQPVISSGTGDVVLGGGAPEKKSRKGLIILIVLIVLLALVGGGYYLWQSGTSGDGSQQAQTTNVQEKYNSYVNYVLWGEESTEKPIIEDIDQLRPYFETLKNDEIDAYLEKANTKYAEFENGYSGYNSQNKVNIISLKVFFQDYAQMRAITSEQLLKMYLDKGFEETKNFVQDKCQISDNNTTDGMRREKNAIKDYSDAFLNIVAKIDKAGCIRDGEIKPGCYKVVDNDEKELLDKASTVDSAEKEIRTSAMDALKSLYTEFYGDSENGGTNEENS